MSRQFEKKIQLFDGKAFGYAVSEYGLERGYLDYRTLSEIVGDCILNNNIIEHTGYENWELESGEVEDGDGNFYEVYQYYIVTAYGARFLTEYTDEIVYYNEQLDMYLWGITHYGTSWDYALTDIELIREE